MEDETGTKKTLSRGRQRASSGGGISVGQKIAHYEILEKIGQGGMGEVFLAQDHSLDRRVALKFLPENVERDPTEKKRFLRGAKSAAALDHPYICNIYGIGEDQHRSFIAMEYVRGETLGARLARERLSLKDVLRIASEIAEALETAHAHHIVHRDLKPPNIMLTLGDHAKVLDFGLAKRVVPMGDGDSQYETASQLTAHGSALGTLAYMSPEQVRGEAVDPRSDIFAFGVVLYEMLAGVHPYQQETPIETAAAILNLEPEPLARYRDDAPQLLEHVIRKMLAKNPASRYQLVHEVRTDLSHVADAAGQTARATEPAVPSSVTPPRARTGSGSKPLSDRIALPRVSRWARAHRKYFAVFGVAIGVVVLVAAVGMWWSSRPPPLTRDLSVAVLPLANASADPLESEYLAEGISQSVSRKLARAGVRVSPWDTVRSYKNTRKPVDRVARELNTDAVLSGTFHLTEDRILINLSMVDVDSGLVSWEDEIRGSYEDLFSFENRIASGAAARLKMEIGDEEVRALTSAASVSLNAYDLYLQGTHILQEGTDGAMNVAYRYFNRALELDRSLAEAHVGLGTVYTDRYFETWAGGTENLDLAEESYAAAVRLNPASVRARRGLVYVNWERGLFEACLIQGQEAARSAPANDVETLLARADAYRLGGLRELALPLYRQIIELDPMNQAAHWLLVVASTFASEPEEAVRVGNRYIRRFGADVDIHWHIAVAHQRLRDRERAWESYEKAIDLVDTASSEKGSLAPSTVAAAFFNAGTFYEQQGETTRAEALWRRGIQLFQRKLEEYPDNAKLRLHLAIFHGLLGEQDAFLSEEEKAFESFDLAAIELLYLATVHAKQDGGGERAVELLRRALRQGRVDTAWRVLFELASVSDRQPELRSLRVEFEAEERRLLRRYGS
ncbi:MAG: serine/threonine-protein kinase [Acidobacteriota bacterium]|nr:MAG: serine/threonine-protein kinase [Acidobacteriota bacterium]